jgi:hypothetical protein
MPRCVVTRRVPVNAAHRLHNPRFSDAENERTFGVVCWRVLEPAVKPADLKRIRLWDTDRTYVDDHGT